MSDLEGVILSDYLLLQCISKGGVADVYRARENGEGNFEVAVKIFRPGYAHREAFRDYFMDEAEKIGQFDHPNILPFLEFGEGEGLLYTVTPFVVPVHLKIYCCGWAASSLQCKLCLLCSSCAVLYNMRTVMM